MISLLMPWFLLYLSLRYGYIFAIIIMCDCGYGINRIPLCEPIEYIDKSFNECWDVILVFTTPKVKQAGRVSECTLCIRVPLFEVIGIIWAYVKWPAIETYIVGKAWNSWKSFLES